jgi:hypothetical protein
MPDRWKDAMRVPSAQFRKLGLSCIWAETLVERCKFRAARSFRHQDVRRSQNSRRRKVRPRWCRACLPGDGYLALQNPRHPHSTEV